jgi:hypothetical protein
MRSTVEYPGIVVRVSVFDHTCFRWVCFRKRMSKICVTFPPSSDMWKKVYGFSPFFAVKLVVFSRFIFVSRKMREFF